MVGKSGCGKTTLLNAIAGFVSFEGHIVKPKRIGMVFQNYAVFPWLTVRGNIAFGIDENDKTTDYYLEMIGMRGQETKYPFELSGGERQRVALARTLASNPDLILMDEPYGSLDECTREKMQKWLLDIWTQEKKTVLLVTHSIEEAILLADRVLVMKNGRIAEEFEINIRRPRNEELRFSRVFIGLRKEIAKSLNA